VHAFPFMHRHTSTHTNTHTHARARARLMIYSLAGARCSKRTMSAWLFQRRISLGDFDNRNVLVLYESSVGKNMSRRLRGHEPKGQRVRWYDYFGKSHNGTLIGTHQAHLHRERERERHTHTHTHTYIGR
jgi:hypothetical protein